MTCPSCGAPLHEQAVICPRCGYQPHANGAFYAGGYAPPPRFRESSGIAIAALICALLVPLVGLILGIVGLTRYQDRTYRKMCIWAVVLAPIVWVINLICSLVLLPTLLAWMAAGV